MSASNTRRLGHVADVRPSSVDKTSKDEEHPVRLCNYTDVYYRDIITSDVEFTEATAPDHHRTRFELRHDDVLLTKDSEGPDDIGVSAWVAEDLPGVLLSYHTALVRPKTTLCGRFLHYALQSAPVLDYFHRTARGVTRYGLRQDDLALTPIPWHAPAEQRRIAHYLDGETRHIEQAIDKNKQLLSLLTERLWANVTHTIETCEGDSMMLGRCLKTVEQGTSPVASVRPRVTPDEWAVLKLSAVTGRVYRPNEHKTLDLDPGEDVRRYEVQAGDVLMTRANTPELVGDACFVESTPRRLVLPDLVYRLVYDETKLDGRWLSWALSSGRVRSQIQGLARGSSKSMVKLRGEDIMGLRLSIPPLPQQRTAVAALEAEAARVAVATERLRRRNDLLRERRRALITEAVAGQLDTAQAA